MHETTGDAVQLEQHQPLQSPMEHRARAEEALRNAWECMGNGTQASELRADSWSAIATAHATLATNG